MTYSPEWTACCRASNRLMDLVCAMYHPGDKKTRLTAPTSTWAEIIAEELGIEIPQSDAADICDNFVRLAKRGLRTGHIPSEQGDAKP